VTTGRNGGHTDVKRAHGTGSDGGCPEYIEVRGGDIVVTGMLGPFGKAEARLEAQAKPINKGGNDAIGVTFVRGLAIRESQCLHGRSIRLPAIGNRLVTFQVLVDGSKVGAQSFVRRIDPSVISEGEQGKEAGGSVDILLDGVQLEALAKEARAKTEMDGVDSQLNLPALLGRLEQEEVVIPIHKEAGSEVMEATGTSRPKFLGSTQGTGLGPEKSLDVRSCSSSGLGRKKSQDARKGCFRNS
jgi:hypothetical protein